MEYGTKNRLWASKNIPNAVMVRTLPRMVTRQNSSPSTVRPTVESLKVSKGRTVKGFVRENPHAVENRSETSGRTSGKGGLRFLRRRGEWEPNPADPR